MQRDSKFHWSQARLTAKLWTVTGQRGANCSPAIGIWPWTITTLTRNSPPVGSFVCSVWPVCPKSCLVSEMTWFILDKKSNQGTERPKRAGTLYQREKNREKSSAKSDHRWTATLSGHQHLGVRGPIKYGPCPARLPMSERAKTMSSDALRVEKTGVCFLKGSSLIKWW